MSKRYQLLEADLEKRLVKKITDLGGLAWKFTSPGTIGVPDRIILFRGVMVFVEMKAPRKDMRAIQKFRATQIEREGFPVMQLNSVEQVDQFVDWLVNRSVKGCHFEVPGTRVSGA